MPTKKNTKISSPIKKKPKKKPIPKFSWKVAFLTVLVLIITGYVIVRLTEAATAPKGDAAYENLQVAPDQVGVVEGLKKVKKNANHPCAGVYEVANKLDSKGKKICTTANELKVEKISPQVASVQRQALQSMQPKPQSVAVQEVKSTGKLSTDPELFKQYQTLTEPTSAAGSAGYQNVTPVSATTPACYGTGVDGKRIVVIAAGTKEKPITDLDKAQIQSSLGQMESILIWNSYRQNQTNIKHWRFMQGSDCKPMILTATQAQDYYADLSVLTYAALHQDSGIAAAANQAYTLGSGQNLVPHFLVFTRSGSNMCGQSDFNLAAGLENKEAYSFVYGMTSTDKSGSACWNGYVAQHEFLHSIGAVDFTAPHTTLFGHCYDQHDIMCYNDTNGAVPMQTICPELPSPDAWMSDYVMDCNADDYFSLKPNADAIFNPNWFLGQTGFTHANLAKSGFMTSDQGSTTLTPSTPPPPNTITPSTPPIVPTDPVPPPPPPTDTQAPTTPGAITKSLGFDPVRFSYYIGLSWPKSTDNVGVSSYTIKRNSVQIGTSTTNSYRDYSIGPNNYYTYEVTAKDAALNASPAAKIVAIGRCFFIWCWLE